MTNTYCLVIKKNVQYSHGIYILKIESRFIHVMSHNNSIYTKMKIKKHCAISIFHMTGSKLSKHKHDQAECVFPGSGCVAPG